MLAPLPRWATTTRPRAGASTAALTYSYERPWKPYRRTPRSHSEVGSGRRCATSGSRRWKAVSKQATWGTPGTAARRRLERGDLGREVQRGERHEGAELGQQRVVDECGAVVVRAAVDDAVADHLQPAVAGEAVQHVVERGVRPVADDLDRAPVDELLGVTPGAVQRVLERGRPAVQAGDQVQSLTSGMSSRCSTTYWRCRSSISWQWAARTSLPSTARRDHFSASRHRW